MKNTLVLSLLLGTSVSTPAQPSGPSLPPVIAFVAPAATFPPGGQALGGVTAPLPVYERTRTAQVGAVLAVPGPRCEASDNCTLAYELVLITGQRIRLDIPKWADETGGLPTYERPVDDGTGRTWAPLDTALGRYWVSVWKDDVKNYVDLVKVVESPTIWCRDAKSCEVVSPAMTREIARIAETSPCSVSPYRVTGTLVVNGRWLYRMELPTPLPGNASTWLPPKILTPVLDVEGQHTGEISSKAC